MAVLLGLSLRVKEARTPDQIPMATFGQPVDMGRSLATPLSLELYREKGRENRLVLTARLENVAGQSHQAYFGAPPTPPELVIGDRQVPSPKIVLKRDGETLVQVQPRLAEEIELIWDVPAGMVPPEVEIRFSKEIFKFRDNLFGQASWLGMEPAARLPAAPKVRT